jgi:hypothetical protein
VSPVDWLGMVAGAIVSIGIIHKAVIYPVYKWARRLEKTMSFVEEQMKPNHGSSLRDSLDRIENRLTLVEAYITNPE